MKKSREELTRIHKEKCKELKKVRAQIAADLGIDLKQAECTYEGYCSGTCPKCKSEEMKLNLAIMKQQMESADMKRKVAAAGLTTAAALSLSGCNAAEPYMLEGVAPAPTETMEVTEGLPDPAIWESEAIEGDLEALEESGSNKVPGNEVEPSEESSEECTLPEIEGKLVVEPETSSEWELSGDIAIIDETTDDSIGESANE